MISEEIIKILKRLIAEKLDVDILDVIPQAELVSDLGADSLEMINLFASIEEEFDNDIEIFDDEIEEIITVQDLFDLVEKKIS